MTRTTMRMRRRRRVKWVHRVHERCMKDHLLYLVGMWGFVYSHTIIPPSLPLKEKSRLKC
jgi:hypothetical protein